MKRLRLIALALFAFWGCVRAPKPPAFPPPSGPPPPAFKKTFGELSFPGDGSIVVRYKEMRILVDPLPSADTSAVDYLLLTKADAAHLDAEAKSAFRKDLKTIVPSGAEVFKRQGFSEAKTLSGGQRLLLRKENAFLFVSAVKVADEEQGYLLEFDNGRNIFIAGEIQNPDALREFVYSLRDDGKQLYETILSPVVRSFVAAGSPAPTAADRLADALALLQSRFTLLLPSRDASAVTEADLRAALKNQIYDGTLYPVSPEETIPF